MHHNLNMTDQVAEQLQTTGSGYDLLRYVCLPDLLGKDATTILYVLGKNIARQIEWQTFDQVVAFFNKTGWGTLADIKQKRSEHIFELTGEAITQRMKSDIVVDYRLEAGFLAEAFQQIKGQACECSEEIYPKKNIVAFHILYTK
ncbi:YslB family protein [Paraliobacillus sediminis]|uniref:YslB family protein n=1 Tax=Paraliobacillus sediminis TaxID=1885916 RepID=UPI001F085F9E|nr:YslB family protein [Paraliobacillus sediminis]